MRILLIEDDRIDMRAVARMLTAIPRAIDLHWAKDGAPALEILIAASRLEMPLIVLLDLHLDTLHGQDVLNALGDLRDHPFLRVFIFTSSAHEDDRHDSAEHWPTGYITKQSLSEDGRELRKLLTETWLELMEQA